MRFAKESPFDSVFAPPDGLEPPTGFISVIEDTICISQIKCRNRAKEELSRSRSPICNLALVAFALGKRRVTRHIMKPEDND